jgi:hypothetical protein
LHAKHSVRRSRAGATKDTITTEPTKRLAVISSNVRGGFFRTLDRRAAMRAATRRHSGKGRAVPERCPSISVFLRSTRLRACVRVRCSEIEISHRVLRARQPAGRGVMRVSCAMEFAARLIRCSAYGPVGADASSLSRWAFLNSARSARGEVLPVPRQDGPPFTPRQVAFGKLKAMTEAKQVLGG